jgi:RNA polymerase sigma factor (sigma-70 family)
MVHLLRIVFVLVVDANDEKGRLAYFLEGDATKTVSDYVWVVVDGYLQWHDYLEQIQQKRSAAVWDALAIEIEKWAYHFLLRKGFHAGKDTQNLAQEYAQEASIAILQAHFPFDTEPKAWLQQIVIYTCCNQIDEWKRQQEIEKKLTQTLADEKLQNISKGVMEHKITSQEESMVICQAIQQLKNPKMRQVVWLRYYGDFSSHEIATVIGSSYRYVDKLHWQAKQKLGKILGG